MDKKSVKKVVEFEDKDIKFILLGRGDYLVDGELVSVNSYDKARVKVINENDVRIVKTTIVVDYYLNLDDNTTMTESEYQNKLSELSKHKTYNDYDEVVWESLEDEFNYRKFKQIWKQITKSIQTISDPIYVEKVNVKYDTGNKFIANAYLNGNDKNHDMYSYNRHAAYLHIVKECFTELGMIFEDKCGYEYTKNRKVWSNSEHSCIRYVTAFGSYIFDDRFKNTNSIKGTLEDMLKAYEHDRNSIRKIIKTKYISTFGSVDDDKVDFKMLLQDLYTLRGNINSIESKKNSWTNQNLANRKINDVIAYIENKFE